jgi:hypothetical protein
MKVSHHDASVGIIKKIHHRAMAAGDENGVTLIEAGCMTSEIRIGFLSPVRLSGILDSPEA